MSPPPFSLHLADDSATAALGKAVAAHVRPKDVLLLDGPVGAGKTAFARALIQAALARTGAHEEVPSPTFTLVQVYDTAAGEIWHCDLYRLGSADEVAELGLSEAMDSAICLIEWPDRLGPARPPRNLTLAFDMAEPGRRVHLLPSGGDWDWIAPMHAALRSGS